MQRHTNTEKRTDSKTHAQTRKRNQRENIEKCHTLPHTHAYLQNKTFIHTVHSPNIRTQTRTYTYTHKTRTQAHIIHTHTNTHTHKTYKHTQLLLAKDTC